LKGGCSGAFVGIAGAENFICIKGAGDFICVIDAEALVGIGGAEDFMCITGGRVPTMRNAGLAIDVLDGMKMLLLGLYYYTEGMATTERGVAVVGSLEDVLKGYGAENPVAFLLRTWCFCGALKAGRLLTKLFFFCRAMPEQVTCVEYRS
jgi:hypothetical protein